MRRMQFSHWHRKPIGVAVLAVVAGLAAWAVSTRSVAQSPAGEARTPIPIDRAPTWFAPADPYDTFSGAVAVDPVRNEIILQSPRKLLVYHREANTPPSASMTEPKRMIAGPKTKMDDNCGLYVDWKTGQVYSIPNDIADRMVVFPPEAKGDVAPERELVTPHTVYGMAVDEEAGEIFLTVQHPPAVAVFSKMARGGDPMLRVLEGNRTQLAYPHGIALDTKNKRIFVSNHGSVALNKDGIGWGRWPVSSSGGGATVWENPVATEWYKDEVVRHKYVDRGNVIPGTGRFVPPSITVYPLKASGDTPPLQVIQGPKTQLNWPMHLYVDSGHGEVFVANNTGHSVLVFRVTDQGDVAPIRVLKGSKTGIKNPTGVYVDTQNDELVVSNMRTHSATVFRRTAEGDTPPLRVIRTAPLGTEAPALGQVTSIAYDSKREEILAPN